VIHALSARPRAALNACPPALLVLFGMVCLHTGSALAVPLFDQVGAGGVTWLRLSWAALVLLVLAAPQLPGALRRARGRDLLGVVLLGTVSAAMMLLYSEATARIDLGVATALEFTGPLAVALLALRSWRQGVRITAALGGVVCLTAPWNGGADLLGAGFGLAAGACLALYIVLTQRVGGRFGVLVGLALSMSVSALLSAPFGVPGVVAGADARLLAATLGVALLFPLLPYLLEMAALRRMDRGAFGAFAGLEPAVGMLMGLVWLAQVPGPLPLLGLALVVGVGLAVARDQGRGAAACPARRPAQEGAAARRASAAIY
jgi:inner membrane transporter RhtA